MRLFILILVLCLSIHPMVADEYTDLGPGYRLAVLVSYDTRETVSLSRKQLADAHQEHSNKYLSHSFMVLLMMQK